MYCCERVHCDIQYIDRANQVIMDLFFFVFFLIHYELKSKLLTSFPG